MQQHVLHKKLFTLSRVDETEYSSIVFERLEKIKIFEKLRQEGGKLETICKALQTSKSTIYRWKQRYKKYGLWGLENQSKCPNQVRKPEWGQSLERKILQLRKQNPLYGKHKIAVILKRDFGTSISVSTAGRIITKLIKHNAIQPASFYYARKRIRPRVFNNHAQRWKKDMKSRMPGELVQIDHMSIAITAGFSAKHFQAICPITKIVVEQVYSRATSNVAKKFLDFMRTQLPFPVRSVQVDGGSEFMGDFEQACKDYNIPLYVLPPKSPEYNGNVERANGSAKFEFYLFYQGANNLFNLRKQLRLYVKKYNTFRPHQALQYLTPLQYYHQLSEA